MTILVPPHVGESVTATFGAFFERINGIDRAILGADHVDSSRYEQNVELLNSCVSLHGKKLLEIGSGYGITLALILSKYGADAVGVEPASEGFSDSLSGARAILAENELDPNRVISASGEQLPFDNETFDVVYSSNVLEHTRDPSKVLKEAVRVLKPGGTLYVEVPNFLSYFEGHYMIPQPPMLFRGMLPAWVKWVWRRDPDFAATLHSEINPIWLRKRLREINAIHPIDVLTLGEARFLARLAQPFHFQTNSVRGIAQKAVKAIQAVNWKNWLGRLIVKAQGHYPIILVAVRR